ncbi:hypothetical protein GCM10009613_61220 [Pseudonocardia kongjuensis]|uniref:Tail terminator n=1 Tax=Pseudonocardia kongjuensis TaxID=102227 RepID=A0ABN1Y9Y1_9PSEU
MSAPTGPETETREAFLDEDGWPIIDKLIANALWATVKIGGVPVYADTDLRGGRMAPHPDDPEPLFHDVDDEHVPLPREERVEWPAIAVERLPGGGINTDGYEDTARIQVTAFGLTRSDSDAMTAQIRGLMRELSDEGWAGVELDRIREDSGPGRIPDPVEDLRTVPTRWVVKARNQQ